ncbi:hypothetical protein RYX36_024797 [Vicia faba]
MHLHLGGVIVPTICVFALHVVTLCRLTVMLARIDDPLEFPLALDQLLNLEMEFKMKWQPRWNNCSVGRIFRDESFIRLRRVWMRPRQDLEITFKHNPDPTTSIESFSAAYEHFINLSDSTIARKKRKLIFDNRKRSHNMTNDSTLTETLFQSITHRARTNHTVNPASSSTASTSHHHITLDTTSESH